MSKRTKRLRLRSATSRPFGETEVRQRDGPFGKTNLHQGRSRGRETHFLIRQMEIGALSTMQPRGRGMPVKFFHEAASLLLWPVMAQRLLAAAEAMAAAR